MLRSIKSSERSLHDGRPGNEYLLAKEMVESLEEIDARICALGLCCRDGITVRLTMDQWETLLLVANLRDDPYSKIFRNLSKLFRPNEEGPANIIVSPFVNAPTLVNNQSISFKLTL